MRAEQKAVVQLPFATRLMRAVDRAQGRRVDVSQQLRVLKRMRDQNRPVHQLTRQLRVIEEHAYDWPDWRTTTNTTEETAARA